MTAPRSNRREFLKSSAGLSAGLGLAALSASRVASAEKEPLFRIALAESSLRSSIPAGRLDHLDFPEFASTRFGIEAVEYWSPLFKKHAKDLDYLRRLRRRADDHGVRGLVILIDGEGYLDDADDAKRKKAVENHYKWVEAAKLLGCHSIRGTFGAPCPTSGDFEEQTRLAVDGLRRLSELCAVDGINAIIENHSGMSAHAGWLASVIEEVDLPNCGTLPDFGRTFNFDMGNGRHYDPYKGIAELMPFAKDVSAKTRKFDVRGNDTEIDFRRMMKVVVDSGYRGDVGIEYSSHQADTEVNGIRMTKRLLQKVREELS
ncbi:MAG: TIM barrel protein [Planctomycetes bacterium]|nr:TIM barrel protein [Planctomycetota bacterium]